MNEGAFERSRALVGDTWMLRNKAPGWVPCFVLVMGAACDGAYACTAELSLCPYARCKLAKHALHLLCAKYARGGRLSSPQPASLGRNAGFTGALHWHTHHRSKTV